MSWGSLSPRFRRFELSTPRRAGPELGISDTVGAVHVGRTSLLIRIGGSGLEAPAPELLAAVTREAGRRLDHGSASPAEHLRALVSWLEEEVRAGLLVRSYTTVSLALVISDAEVWTWHVGPHGVACGPGDGLLFRNTDFRFPVLRQLGLLEKATVNLPGRAASDAASSIYCIGAPAGYEALQLELLPRDAAVVFERASLPFGPLPHEPVPASRVWAMEAGWSHGLSGPVLLLGAVTPRDLELPAEWQVREVPMDPTRSPPGLRALRP